MSRFDKGTDTPQGLASFGGQAGLTSSSSRAFSSNASFASSASMSSRSRAAAAAATALASASALNSSDSSALVIASTAALAFACPKLSVPFSAVTSAMDASASLQCETESGIMFPGVPGCGCNARPIVSRGNGDGSAAEISGSESDALPASEPLPVSMKLRDLRARRAPSRGLFA